MQSLFICVVTGRSFLFTTLRCLNVTMSFCKRDRKKVEMHVKNELAVLYPVGLVFFVRCY